VSAVATRTATRTRDRDAHLEQPPVEAPDERLFEPRGTTLEDVVLGLWEDLVAGRDATCPVCNEGSMSMIGCSTCGSELS
jgi:hypothetical protein